MGKYSVISEVGQYLTDLLADGLTPDLVSDRNSIGLCSPDERGDFVLGIYLYDIRESEDMKLNGMINTGLREQRFPPKMLTLYYMITAYSVSDVKFRAAQEHRMLGRVIQILGDNNLISADVLGNRAGQMNARIEMLDLSSEDKMKIWNDATKPYKPSLCYRVTPVELESARTRKVERVREIQIGIGEQKGR